MNMKRSILTAIAGSVLLLCAGQGQATGVRGTISSECALQHSGTSDPARQAEIERTCSATNAGTRVTTAEQQRRLLEDTPIKEQREWEREHYSSGTYSALSPDGTGMNAGGTFNNIGVWGSFNSGNVDNDFVFSPYDMTSRGFMVGADFQPMENAVLGLSAGYNHDDIETTFNGGKVKTDTATVAAYGAMALAGGLSVDAVLGYSDLNTTQNRLSLFIAGFSDPFAALAPGTPIDSDVDATRLFGAINLNGFWNPRHFLVSATVGYLYSETDQDSFTESGGGVSVTRPGETFVLSQWHAGATLGYDFGTFLEPYAGADYSYDISREEVTVGTGLQQPANDRSELIYRIGMRYYGDNGISAALEWNANALRQDIDSNGLMLTLRLDL